MYVHPAVECWGKMGLYLSRNQIYSLCYCMFWNALQLISHTHAEWEPLRVAVILYSVWPKEFKREIGSLLDACVNTMGRRQFWWSHIEASYCTSGFGVIIWHDLRKLMCSTLNACMIFKSILLSVSFFRVLKSTREKDTLNKIAWQALVLKILLWYNNSASYVMARWLPLQMSPSNLLGTTLLQGRWRLKLTSTYELII